MLKIIKYRNHLHRDEAQWKVNITQLLACVLYHAASSSGTMSGIRTDQNWLFLLNHPQMTQAGFCSLDLEGNLPGNSPRDPSPLPPNQINSSTLSGLPASVYSCWPHEPVKHGTDDWRKHSKTWSGFGERGRDTAIRQERNWVGEQKREW